MSTPFLTVLLGPGSEDGAALVAAGIPVNPRSDWFNYRDMPNGTPLTFTTDGQVYGLLAPRTIDHIGLPGRRRRAPHSSTNYSWFHTGQVRCDDGSLVSTGRITMLTGHADLDSDAQTAAAHYDNSGTAVADVVAFDRPDGVYCAGAARPGVTPEQMRMAMASPASGDWRPIPGSSEPEMVAALLVNTAGFPARRPNMALAASGEVEALIAGGELMPRIVTVRTTPDEEPPMSEPTPDAVTAAAEEDAPAVAYSEGDVVSIDGVDYIGTVLDDADDPDLVAVRIEVPAGKVSAATDEQKSMVSSAVKTRLRDREIESRFAKLTASVEAATSRAESAEARARGVAALSDLGALPE